MCAHSVLLNRLSFSSVELFSGRFEAACSASDEPSDSPLIEQHAKTTYLICVSYQFAKEERSLIYSIAGALAYLRRYLGQNTGPRRQLN